MCTEHISGNSDPLKPLGQRHAICLKASVDTAVPIVLGLKGTNMTLKLMPMVAAAALCACLTPAHAQLVATGLDCNAGNVMQTGFDPDALACSGAWAGNISPQLADVEAQLATDFAAFVGADADFTLVGKSDDENSGPFVGNPDQSTGTLTFDTAITGLFVIGLKASESFSFYLFDGGMSGLTSIDFSTAGVSLNNQGVAQGLSHAALFVLENGQVPGIPEPQTYALMLGGLGALAMVARRRRPV
jgi:hypothetical protein